MKKTKLLALFLVISVFSTSISAGASSGSSIKKENIYTDTTTILTKNKNEKVSFDKEITRNGKTFILKDVKYDILSKTPEKEEVTHSEEQLVTNGEDFTPPNEITKDNILYKLSVIEDVPAEPYIQPVEAHTDYEKAVSKNTVPAEKTVSVQNLKTGKTESVVCKLNDVSKVGEKWVNSHIDFTFKNYDSYVFEWQGVTIKNENTPNPLENYKTQLLKSVGLTLDNAIVNTTYWTSEAYVKDGILCRNARADIRKKVPVYRANYTGSINTEMTTKKIEYKGSMDSNSDFNYKIKATATYERDMDTFYITVGIGIILFVILIVLVLFVISKEKNLKEKTKENITNE